MANLEITQLPAKASPLSNDLLVTKDQGDNGDYKLLLSQLKVFTNTNLATPSAGGDAASKTYVDTTISNLPSPMLFKGGIDLSTGDAALPVSPANGWQYVVTVGGSITATKDGTTATSTLVQPNDLVVYDGTVPVWWVFDADGNSLQPVKEITTPYTLLNQDTGKFLVFNAVGDGTVTIPDGLFIGHSTAITNIGGGNVILSYNTETVRGATTLSDVTGYLATTKLTSSVWQSSERA